MFAEIGLLALIANLCAAFLLVVIPCYGIYSAKLNLLNTATYYVILQWVCGAIAFVCLDLAFLTDDFRLIYVQMNSSLTLPWFYKACALWGGHEGSMLLWVCILQTWTLAFALTSKKLAKVMQTRILVIQGLISIGFLLFILLTSNPFIMEFTLNATGRDLNPLLQDPGFLLHPPMLYVGYVGFSIAFSVAVSLLWAGEIDYYALSLSRPWILFAFATLTLGVVLGSWWAYRELGWGGFWFWDPVENASFMPWLVATALIHALLVVESRKMMVAWFILLAIIVFSLSLIGTFLVRSGVLTSVHAFAVDPLRGIYILGMLAFYVGGALLLFAFRAQYMFVKAKIGLVSREMLILLNNVLLVSAMLTVLLGTIYPLIIDALGLGKISVGVPYFNAVFVPPFLILLFITGLSLFFPWGKANITQVMRTLSLAFGVSLLVFIYFLSKQQNMLMLAIATGLSIWVCLTTLQRLGQKIREQGIRQLSYKAYGTTIAHVGIGVTALGVAVSSGLGKQIDTVMQPKESIKFAGYTFEFNKEESIKGPNYHGVRGVFYFKPKKGPFKKALYPEKRIYDVSNTPMTDAAVDVNILRDIYVALGDPVGENSWGVRLYYKPLVRFIWLGGLMIFLGALVAMCDLRRLQGIKK
ncbi:MAG: c-type cytochrome biogenesis protein CcmF [Legionellales bacterium RIFCSPHIGHO2_12_FULL_37_14]|nr:MAG: c-type cytochrome biogenesis protein CcmF [Legionellales bacterium RIFCSPHIGHO2_12_FULL_37_14]